MREADLDVFTTMLDSVCSLLSRGVYQPSASNSAMFFRALAKYDLADVRKALDAHVSDPARGRFVPTPADLIAQLESVAGDGRPEADEAWAIAIRAADEYDTVVWTYEIAQAWEAVRIVFQSDEIGARVAFRAAYTRMVDAARAANSRPVWTASEGFDPELRRVAMTRAVELGRIDGAQLAQLVAPAQPVGLLENAAKIGAPTEAIEAIERFKAKAAARHPLQWARDLKALECAGESLTLAQAHAWREALDKAPANQSVHGPAGGDYEPIPNDALPPAMRRKER